MINITCVVLQRQNHLTKAVIYRQITPSKPSLLTRIKTPYLVYHDYTQLKQNLPIVQKT